MRTQHMHRPLPNFPIYSAAFVSKDVVALGGGGGSGRTGVKNRIKLFKVQSSLNIEELDEYTLVKGDAPMSMAVHHKRSELVCGINALREDLAGIASKPENCRIFSVNHAKIKPMNCCSTFKAEDLEYYQNVTVFSPKQDLLAVGSTTNEVSLLSYPGLKPKLLLHSTSGRLHDVTMSSDSLIVVNSTSLDIYSLPITSKSRTPLTISVPTSPTPDLTFRAARFDPHQPQHFYTAMNPTPRSGRKASPRYSYLLKWDTGKWRVVKSRRVVDKPVTCFDMSSDGKLLAIGCADYSIRLVDARTLSPFLTILKAHEFPPTTLRFNFDNSLLISASVDSAIRVIAVPEKGDTATSKKFLALIIGLLVLLLGLYLRRVQSFRWN